MFTSTELCSVEEIIERIKDIISIPVGNRKVFDNDVSMALNMSQMNLASRKRRNKIPYENIILFCDRYGHDPMKIIMKKELLESI
ncbi:hypothetical protein [Sulfurimonas sp.]|uniref:hypothetical protein n=1 Tax=Sulfurimonas sp. TaxID=2022749 RepID=UPI0025DCD8B9|nr:hypothetical protein [Sulfurimonas sp.]